MPPNHRNNPKYPHPQRHRYPAQRTQEPHHNNSYQNQLKLHSTHIILLRTTQTLPLRPTPHALKLPHKRLLHLLIPRPRLLHLPHAQRSNNRETDRAQRGLLLADGGVGCDADVFEEAEVGGVAVGFKVSIRISIE